MRYKPLCIALALAFAGPAFAAGDAMTPSVEQRLKQLADRVEQLEKHNQELEKSLASERVSENEPEIATRLKAVEFQTLTMQKQARQIEALEGITVGASVTSVVQGVNARGSANGDSETRANYRGDISVTLPGGEMGNTEGKIFAHLRFGQGNGVGIRPTYTSTINTTAFQVGSVDPDDSFGVAAQLWYQLKMPLGDFGRKEDAREHLYMTFGKIDPFVFFDQNAAADDESAKFLNNVFVHNPLLDSGGDIGADKYGFAPGIIAQYKNSRSKASEWGLSMGVFSPSGTRANNGANFNGSMGDPMVIIQADTTARMNYLPGNYRAYMWRNGQGVGYDGVERNHTGFGLSVDQKVADSVTLFGRYGHQVAGKTMFDRAITFGAEIDGGKWGRAADSLGMAAGALRTSSDFRDDSLTLADFGYQASGWEKQFEVYYRFKVNNRFELTPDIQRIVRSAGDRSASGVTAVGLRAKFGF